MFLCTHKPALTFVGNGRKCFVTLALDRNCLRLHHKCRLFEVHNMSWDLDAEVFDSVLKQLQWDSQLPTVQQLLSIHPFQKALTCGLTYSLPIQYVCVHRDGFCVRFAHFQSSRSALKTIQPFEKPVLWYFSLWKCLTKQQLNGCTMSV